MATLRRTTAREATQAVLLKRAEQEGTPAFVELKTDYERARRVYWDARQRYSRYLPQHDRELWRMLMPCDPVITVADDVCFFECFSGDESSYGCLSVNRGDGFGRADDVKFGTTNVDYSWNLYHHFQTLRTYRNGELVQEAHIGEEMVWGPHYMVADIARHITLLPGDVILTGTPCHSRSLEVGDTVEVEISGIGRLSSRVAAGPVPRASALGVGHAPTDSAEVRRVALGFDERVPERFKEGYRKASEKQR